jgi:tRNA(Ile)-lysidine synthetase-like protein
LRARRFEPGSILVLGFSGGIDSLALAAALARVAGLAQATVVLAHVDHGLRPESWTEQDGAFALARQLGLSLHRLALAEDPVRLHPGLGLEEAARRERYRELAALCGALDARALVLAHHRDDQAETVLLHLLRGAGLSGSRGMAEWTERRVPWWGVPENPQVLATWRPFLDEARVDLAAYTERHRLRPVGDPSNEDRRFRRNALRHDLLPRMEAAVPGAVAALARHARLVADDDDALETIGRRLAGSATMPDGSLTLPAVRDVPRAIARRVLRTWVGDQSRGAVEATAERIEALVDRASTGAGGRIDLGGGWTAMAESGRLRLKRAGEGFG